VPNWVRGQRRRALIRTTWRELLKGLVVGVMFAVAFTVIASVLFGSNWGYFAAGMCVGAFWTLWLAAFSLIDPTGARLARGYEGEIDSARQLRHLEADGWVSVHNLNFKDGEVDHVVVGPGGVVVVETKTSNGDWEYLLRRGEVERWAVQVTKGAMRVRAVIRQHTGLSTEPVAVVAAWVNDAPGAPATVRNASVVHGEVLADTVRASTGHLERDQVAEIAACLNRLSHDYDSPRQQRWWHRFHSTTK
jgi:hypothetical protein